MTDTYYLTMLANNGQYEHGLHRTLEGAKAGLLASLLQLYGHYEQDEEVDPDGLDLEFLTEWAQDEMSYDVTTATATLED